ncbi:HAD family phosphatase [uncultured Enterococcus sp.]|uniref:HAD family hydrolase n=1 Tax=uncultured Enterococcus sp. TaxID=167972 RepID=UPI002AA93182|nr:HAD family phosphatase [uncultured Enterococcus sp.]
MNRQAIIFDMDGVIVDTEFLDYQFQKEFIARENGAVSNDEAVDYSALVGRSYDDLYRTMQTFLNKEYSLEELKQAFIGFNEERYHSLDYPALFRKDIKAILEEAKQQNRLLAVASSSEYAHIIEVLEACGIEKYFDVIYSGEFVKESKPNPEIYRKTLEKLGVTPENALAIEDSSYGIRAAKEAGIQTIAYKETRMAIDQSEADYLGEDMYEIRAIITAHFENLNL